MIPGLLDYIIDNHREKTAEKMAGHLGTSVTYVQAVCYHNNLQPYIPQPHWTDTEIQRLKEIYPHAQWHELQEHFPNRNYDSIRRKASEVGVTRSRNPQNQSHKS